MAEVTMRHGDPTHIDYTPAAGDIDAGEVVLLGNTAGLSCGISDRDILNTVKGSLAIGGVWEAVNLNNSADGAKVYWDDSVSKITSVSTNNALFGFIVSRGGGGANSACDVMHEPFV